MTDRTQEKPTKGRVRWTDKRRVPEEGLERFEDYLQTYSRNRNHPVKILFSFYKGTQAKLLKACAYLVLQRSPVWVIPIVTSNIISRKREDDVTWLACCQSKQHKHYGDCDEASVLHCSSKG